MQDFRGLALEDLESANIQRLRDVKGVRRKVEYYQIGYGKLDNADSHMRHMATDKDDAWLAVNLVFVAYSLVNLLEQCQEHWPLQHRGVGNSVCSAWHTTILADPVLSQTLSCQDD